MLTVIYSGAHTVNEFLCNQNSTFLTCFLWIMLSHTLVRLSVPHFLCRVVERTLDLTRCCAPGAGLCIRCALAWELPPCDLGLCWHVSFSEAVLDHHCGLLCFCLTVFHAHLPLSSFSVCLNFSPPSSFLSPLPFSYLTDHSMYATRLAYCLWLLLK